MSSKRRAERDVDEIAKASGVHTFREEGKGDEIEGDVETVVKASAEVMATRTILTAKRKNPTASAASAAVKESAAPVKGGETEAARNPFAAGFAPANQWKCSLCGVNNSDTLSKCRGCDTVKAGKHSAGEATGTAVEEAKEVVTQPVAAKANPFAAGLTKVSEWRCGACGVNNDKKLSKCKGCESVNPNGANGTEGSTETKGDEKEANKEEKEGEKKSSPFGDGSAFGSGSTSSLYSFSASASGSTGFSFLPPAGSATDSVPAFSFSSTFSGFGEGSSSIFATSSADKAAGEGVDGESVRFKVYSELFKDAKAEDSGDSDDTVTFSMKDAKVFQLMPVTRTTTGEDGVPHSETKVDWVDSGKGEVCVNTYVGDGGKLRGRILCRREKTLQLVANAPLFAEVKFDLMNSKNVRIVTIDVNNTNSGKKAENATYLFRATGRGETAQSLFDAIGKVVEELKAQK